MQRINFFWKIFIAITLVVVISFFMLILTLRLSLPNAFDNHMDAMRSVMMGGGMGGHMMTTQLYDLLNISVNEALWIAVPIALLITLIASWIISRLVTAPARQIFHAAQGIASGDYQKRIPLPKNQPEENMDDLLRMAAGFNHMAASLEETETKRRQLIGDISHELRTPLTTIKGSMEGLIDGVLPADETTYQQIYHEAARLERLVDDLQELSRIEGGAFTLERKPVSFNQLSQAICQRLTPVFDEKSVSLLNHSTQDLPQLSADPDRLEQILLNLLTNALRHTPAGGEVSIHTVLKNNNLQVEIRDTGAGIAPEHLPHIFTRFYRADRSRARSEGGSGIGLTIAKHLVEAHGGQIQAFSEGLGKGSVFRFTMPIVA